MAERRTVADRFRAGWKLANRLEAAQLRWLGTSGVKVLRRTDVLVLETTGRRTGKLRRVPLAYWSEGDDYFVGGGAGGMTKVDWVANVRAAPRAAVWVRRRRIPVRVEELAGDDYERARRYAFGRWPEAEGYERRSHRRIPYFRLRPDGQSEPG